jgi:putative AlgH/UPF0301 family transcriptional regulator
MQLLCHMKAGCLLIGRQPGMGVFERAIVLMVEHNDRKGSVGLVLNLPSPLLVNEVAWQLPAVKGEEIACKPLCICVTCLKST